MHDADHADRGDARSRASARSRTRNASDMPRNERDDQHRDAQAEAPPRRAIRRPVGQCASIASERSRPARLSRFRGRRGMLRAMGIGTSIFLIAVGAILYFAVNADVSGLEISTVGLILMICGSLGLVISLFFLSSARAARRPSARSSATASRTRRAPCRPPLPARAGRSRGRRGGGPCSRAAERMSACQREPSRGAAARVEAQPGDDHVGVAGVGVDGHPLRPCPPRPSS